MGSGAEERKMGDGQTNEKEQFSNNSRQGNIDPTFN
jgi:hypothetical protein